MSHDLKMFNFS